ncbi:hypothetical protein OE88DRAFT_1738362 [Heliocybe sulcata]|uniref:ABM domain-containing protein n=1 Tax=Heliocybe sulcata TaxID=5364 RepID=A0A5C3MSI4_9AGAM|nr:hypothetical protein OE88DRAFT_1738362 [Heliocybe sulcata]
MSTHITEILRVTVSGRFTSEPSLHVKLRAGAAKGGLVQQLTSVTDLDVFLRMLHPVFPAQLAPKDFQWPAECGDFLEKFADISTGGPVSCFLPFPLPLEAVKVPITELGFITVKPAANRDDFSRVLDSLVSIASGAPGCLGGGWAFSSDDDSKVYCVLGWESIGVGTEKLREQEDHKRESELLTQFMAAAEAVHVRFATQNI